MTNIKVIRGEDNKYEYINNSYNIKFKCVVDDCEDNEDISDWCYNPCLIDRVPLFEIWYTYISYPVTIDSEPEEVNASMDIFINDTLIFGDERFEIKEPEFDMRCPKMSDFYKYVRHIMSIIEHNFNTVTAINQLE